MIDYNEIHPSRMKRPVIDTSGAELSIRDASFPKPFHIGLQYSSPARGTWTIAHSTMLIPELHQIFVCCACCLQGVVLSADEMEGGAERFSMVTVTNENIIKGNLEEMMIDGVTDILQELPSLPPCVECFTSCIQHFLHIDLKVVYRTLRERFPGVDFIDGYMIPTLQRKFTPDILGRRQLMRAVQPLPQKEPADGRKQVNLIVNYFPTDKESELFELLHSNSCSVVDFADCSTYAQYKSMGASMANLYFAEGSGPAAKDMERRLGQKPVFVPYAFEYTRIRAGYKVLADALGFSLPEEAWFEALEKETEESLARLHNLIGDTAVAIDYTATPYPLQLARFLLDHGIHVYAVYLDEMAPAEKDAFLYLQENYPDLQLRCVSHFKRSLLPRNDAQKLHEKGGVLAIGQKAAYFTGTDHFVNLIENSGLYGYRGIQKLCSLMEDAYREPSDVKSIIQVKAWGCRG